MNSPSRQNSGDKIDRQQNPDINRPFIKELVEQVSQTPMSKLAQIGIEPSVLGMPRENVTFAKAKSYFIDTPFDTTESAKVPKQWLEFANLPSPLNIITSMPEQTLFFMFYTQPNDLIQIAASEELQNRGWTYDATDGRWSCENEQEETFTFDLHSWAIKKL